MKRVLVLMTAMAITGNVVADCTKAYEARAQKREKRNFVIKKTALYTGAGLLLWAGARVGGGIFEAAGNKAIVGTLGNIAATGIGAYLAFDPAVEAYTMVKPDSPAEMYNNTFSKSLRAINAAKKGTLSKELAAKISKKKFFSTATLEEQKAFTTQAIKALATANELDYICPTNRKGKVKTLNFRRISRYVMQRMITKI